MLTGIFLGLMVALGQILTFNKLPEGIKKWLSDHELFTDILAGVIIWTILGAISKSITAIIGAIVAELVLVLGLKYYARKLKELPDVIAGTKH